MFWNCAQSIHRHFLSALLQKLDEHNIFLLSGGLTFFVGVCFLPLFLIVFSILGAVVETQLVQNQIDKFIDNLIPIQDYAYRLKEIIFSRLQEFARQKLGLGILGLLGLLLTSSSLFGAIRSVLDIVFACKVQRSVLFKKLDDFKIILMVLFLSLVSIFMPPLEILVGLLYHYFDKLPFIEEILFSPLVLPLLSWVLVFAMFSVVYYLVPSEKPPLRVALLSAFLATSFWTLAKIAFRQYLDSFDAWSRIYGTYVLFVVLAFWLYYSSFIFIFSAEIAQIYREKLLRNKAPTPRSPSRPSTP